MNSEEKKNEYKKLIITHTNLINVIVDIVHAYLGINIILPKPTEIVLGFSIVIRPIYK
jgi:hypothetical protein